MTQRELVDKWLSISIERLKKNIDDLQVIDTGSLKSSLKGEITGDFKIQLKYLLYGKYVDIGTGRGVARGKRGTDAFAKARRDDGKLKSYNRKAKRWYSKQITAETKRLGDLLSDYAGTTSVAFLKDSIPSKLTFDL